MKFLSCEREQQVIVALQSGDVPADVQDHIDTCVACQDAQFAWSFLHTAALTSAQDTGLPSSGLVWWRAQLAEKRALATRSVAPIKAVQQAVLAAAALFVVVSAVLFGPQLFDKAPPVLTAVVSTALFAVVLTASSLAIWSKMANDKPRR